MPTIFIDLPHNKGSFEIELKNDRQQVIIKEFLDIIVKYDLDIDKQDLDNIFRIAGI